MIVKIIYKEESKDSLADVEYIDAKNCAIMDNKNIGENSNNEYEYVTVVINERQSPYEVHKKRGRIVIMNDEGKIIDVHLSGIDTWDE